jgi:ABC-2 type transport system ATP-binding protein
MSGNMVESSLAAQPTPEPRSAPSPAPAEAPALELVGLSKAFGPLQAVDDVNLVVPAGSFYGLVGPNGAGKTTTLSMAVGLMRPDGGSARIFGVDVWPDGVRAKALVGVLPEGLALPERLTGRELLTYLGRLHGLDARVVADRAGELLEVLDLVEAEQTLVIEYSTGMRKKIGLAASLIHGPKLLVLDEPFEGVDPVSATTIRSILQRFVAGGGAVMFSSHVMALVEQLCSHVAVISDGRVLAAGRLDDVRGERRLEAVFVDLVGAEVRGLEGLSWLRS